MSDTSDAPRTPEYYSCNDGYETLIHTDRDEAIHDYLDQYDDDNAPDTVTVYGFAKMVPDAKWQAITMLDNLLDVLDNEYGDPNGHAGQYGATDTMRDAALEFVNKVLAEYRVYACDEVSCETVNVDEWRKEHNS